MYNSYILLLCLCVFGFTSSAQVEGTLLGSWSDDSLVPSTNHNNTYNEVWGYVANGHEIAIIGSTLGTHFLDVTNPSDVVELFIVEGGSSGPEIIHRDFHDYKGYLYSIADQGSNTGLQIIDMTNLPESIEVVYNSRQYFTRSHNIFIDESKGRLYSLISNGTELPFSPMRIFDLSDPIDPQPIGSYNNFDGHQISQVHDAYIRNDTAYLNLGPHGFALVDFADVDTPNVISILTPAEYPQSGYNHSGWLTDNGEYYYMADENFGSDLKVMDMRNLPDIDIPTLFNAQSTRETTIPHNQIINGNKLYVSYYYDGLQVYDISDPINPIREMYYNTSTEEPTVGLYRGAWGVYPYLPSGNILVSDMQNGLFIIDGKLPTSTQEILYDTPFSISPNPSTGNFNIKFKTNLDTDSYIQIFDAMGKLVIEKTSLSSSTDLKLQSRLEDGIYIIKIQNGKETYNKQLLILK